jgi:hypothetical protein
MTQAVRKSSRDAPRHPLAPTRSTEVEGMALVALRSMTASEMRRMVRVLETEGITGVRLAKVRLSRADARRVAEGGAASVQATLVSEERPSADETPEQALERALSDARARGDAVKQELLTDPGMLNTDGMAERLGMSSEGVRLKRKRHEVLGVDFAKRGIRYPSWQLLENRQLLPGLPRLFSILGEDPWGVYRFLLQSHPELGGRRALDALKRGRTDEVLAVAEAIAAGAFA